MRHFRTPPSNLDSEASITFGDKTIKINAGDLVMQEVLGRGAYGVVEKYVHRPTGTIMAVKVCTSSLFQLLKLTNYMGLTIKKLNSVE